MNTIFRWASSDDGQCNVTYDMAHILVNPFSHPEDAFYVAEKV